jgi:ribonucleoside-diphosphate reductase alpha chain
MVDNPFTEDAEFDWDKYKEVVRIFSRMLDNVVEFNGLPLASQRKEITRKRRHGMGFLGLGSMFSLMGIEYGSQESVALTEEIMKVMAVEGYREGIELAKEKGPAPIFHESFNGVPAKQAWADGKFMRKIWSADPELEKDARKYGCRYTHATSIAPTGTISLSLNNNASNGIEPSFSHKYTRNVIRAGKKSKEAVNVYSYEMLLWKHVTGSDEVPETFSTSDNVSPAAHVNIQAAAQKWCDSSISKTINVPTDTKFEDFEKIYLYAYKMGLKGCTTFRFNPEAFQGVLVKEDDLENTEYVFECEDGTKHVAKGNEKIVYDGEEHTAANLYDSIKEKYYGRF